MTSKNVSKEKLVHIGPKGEKLVPMHEAKRWIEQFMRRVFKLQIRWDFKV